MTAAGPDSGAEPRPVWNRVVFVLSLLGALVSAYLWRMHAIGADVPCGGSGGCDAVAASPYSRFPVGSGIPVAAYGAVGYTLLALLALGRTLTARPGRHRLLLALIALGAGAGTLASLYLTYLELWVIRAVCRWCLASQFLIAAVFVASLADWRRVRTTPSPIHEVGAHP